MGISRRTFSKLSLGAWLGSSPDVRAEAALRADLTTPVQIDRIDGILVPEHFVPIPTTVSPQAQDMLRSASLVRPRIVKPDGTDDLVGWQAYLTAYRRAGDRGILAMAERLDFASRYPAEVLTHQLSASRIFEITPHDLAPENDGRAIYYIHGGAFTLGGGDAAIILGKQMAGLSRCRTYAIDYRMVPQVSFPVPVDDCLEGYRFILSRCSPQAIAVYGPSAGANLAPAMLLKARDEGVKLPAACALHSSPSDLSEPGDSIHINRVVDIVLDHYDADIFDAYVGGHHDRRDPYLSPVYGDYSKGFPPTILVSGTRDLLLSGTVRLHRAMLRGGVNAQLHVWEAMPHAPFIGAPEEAEFYDQLVDFVLGHMTAG